MEIVIRLVWALRSRVAQFFFRCRGVRIEGPVWLHAVSIPRNPWDIRLERGAMLDERVTLQATGARAAEPRIVIRAGAYLNRDVFIDAAARIEIGRSVLIGPASYITDHDHDLKERSRLVCEPTCIEEGAWLGARVIVLKGVTIGAGAVIGAGSVVTRSVPPRCVAVGNPARVIKEIGPGEEMPVTP